ncbi:MAG: radical SAM protein [Myxococcota bacterium]
MGAELNAAVDQAKTVEHEEAAHEKRNWVRLTYDCNDRCVFCLDAHTHDGTNRDREEIRAQILDGRRKGAQRLILSGGEPTIHPDFIKFVKLGRLAGYRKVQTVTNGRMFAYRDFLTRSVDAGLSEITFSIHGPNARVHDALVGTKGAFEQEVKGLQHALEDGRPIINIDVCVNKGNVKTLPDILSTFVGMGVKEYDLLHVIPFGRAYTEGKETLFYDLESMRPFLLEAFEYSKRPDIHIWLNRFPVPHLEGYESLIQDPYKLNDEVRGRKEEYAQLLDRGIPLDCRAPDRCRHCYLEPLCDRLDEVRTLVAEQTFERVRIDPRFEASMPAVYGGDPATKKRAEALNQVVEEAQAGNVEARKRLPVLGGGAPVSYPSVAEHVAAAQRLWVAAASVEDARQVVASVPAQVVELELDEVEGVGDQLGDATVHRVYVSTVDAAEALLAQEAAFEVAVALSGQTAPWLESLEEAPARLVVVQPTHDRLTTAAQRDVELGPFFERFTLPVPVEGVPTCIAGDRARPTPVTLDTSMMTPDGRLEIFHYARRYVQTDYRVKSLRCKACVHVDACEGLHVNHVRAFGFAGLQPVQG